MQWYLIAWISRQTIVSQLASLYLLLCLQDRFGNYKKLLKHVKHKNHTELSKEFWELKMVMRKKRNGTPKITWRIIRIYPLTIQTVSVAFYV